MSTDVSGQARAAAILARLDRLPSTRHVWWLITLLSLGGMFELYDLFMTAYVVPGLMKAGLLTNAARVLLTGKAVAPGIFQVMHMLGQKRTVERLRKAF